MKDEDVLPWFPCEQGKLLGALAAMKPHVGYTYWIVCLRIYDVGGPVADSLDAIARRTGYNKRVVSDALDTLFRSGKLVREGDSIMNPYAREILDDMAQRRTIAVASGHRGASGKWKNGKSSSTTRYERLAAARQKGTHTALEWESLLNFCGSKCLKCGAAETLKDHIVPLYQGGSDAIANLQPLCRSCNSAKGADAQDRRPAGWENAVKSIIDACLPQQPTSAQEQLQLQETDQVIKPRAKRRAPRAMISPDWKPDERDVAHAVTLGLGGRVAQMAAAMVNHHRSRGTMIADVAATWRTWCNNEVKFAAERAARLNGTNPSKGTAIFAMAMGNDDEQGSHR